MLSMFPKEDVIFLPGEEKSCLRLACHLGENQIWQVDKNRAGSSRCAVKCVGKSSLCCQFRYLFSLRVSGMSPPALGAAVPAAPTFPAALRKQLAGKGPQRLIHIVWLADLYFSVLTLSLFYR